MSNFSKLAEGAANFACGIYKNMPGALIPTPASELLTMVWDNLCGEPPRSPANLPPPPGKPFDGGQCCDIDYKIVFRTSYPDGRPPSENTSFNIYQGTILGLQLRQFGDGAATRIYTILKWKKCDGRVLEETIGQDNFPRTFSISIVNAYPAYGVPDRCGNPPPDFPPTLPPPPGGYISPPTTINFNDNSQNNFIFKFSPPPPPTSPLKAPPPIVINIASANANFNFDIDFNFDGTIKFGDGGTGGGGGGGSNFNQDDRDNINNIKNVTNNTNNTTNNTNNNVDNFYSDYKKERDKTDNKPPLPTDFDPPKPATLPGKHSQERLAFVNVDLTTIPKNAKSQSGKSAPNIIYAGWFEFTRQGKSLPRNYIHFANNCFVAPIGADGYAFTLYNGYEGIAVAITNKE